MNWVDHTILLMSCAAELYICHDFFHAFFDKRGIVQGRGGSIIVFFVFVPLIFGINIMGHSTINIVCIPLFLLLYLIFVFRGKGLQFAMYFLMTISVLIGCEFLFSVIDGITGTDSALSLSDMPWQTFTMKLMSFILLTGIRQFSDRSKNKITRKAFWLFMLIPVASLCLMMSTYLVNRENLHDVHVKLLLSSSFAFMLLGNFLVFSVFNRYAKDLYLSMQQNWMLAQERMNRQHYEKLADMNENRRVMVHDFKHYLSTLRAIVKSGDKREVLDFLQELNVKLDSNERRLHCGIPVLDAVLSEKEECARECNVKMYIEVEPGCAMEGVPQMDYFVMIGNLLDNAIQAAEKNFSDPHVKVNIFMGNAGHFFITKIRNSYNEKYLIQRGDEFLSNKKERNMHGIGLKSVKKTAEDCGGIFRTDIQSSEFIATLIFPIKTF